MDPTTALEELIDAALNGEPEMLLERAEALAAWLECGGFNPNLEEIRSHVASLHRN